MRRLVWVIVGILIGAGGLSALPSGAQYDAAPVQIQYTMDYLMVMYDCYPAQTDSAALQVFIMRPDGMAIYNCMALDSSRVFPLNPWGKFVNLSATY